MIAAIDRLLRPVRIRIANMVARAVVRLVNDGGGVQVLQLSVLDGETREAVERLQNYGFTSVPLPGAEAVALFVGGRRDNGFAVAVDDRRYRPRDLAEGDAAVYNSAGLLLILKSDRAVLTAPEVRLGSDNATNYVAMANLVESQFAALKSAIAGAAVTAGDGGAAFKANIGTALAAWPATVAAGKVKAE